MKILAKNKKYFLIFFSIISFLFLSAFVFVKLYASRIEKAEKILAKSNIEFFNSGCVIKTLGQNPETISAEISFYTPNGNLAGRYERAWNGWELNIECFSLKLKNGNLVFPYRIFSDKSKRGTGIKLMPYYSTNNFPEIYEYPFLTNEEREAIKTLFKSAKFSPYMFLTFSSLKKKTIRLRNFEHDAEYNLISSKTGTIILQKIN